MAFGHSSAYSWCHAHAAVRVARQSAWSHRSRRNHRRTDAARGALAKAPLCEPCTRPGSQSMGNAGDTFLQRLRLATLECFRHTNGSRVDTRAIGIVMGTRCGDVALVVAAVELAIGREYFVSFL